MMLRIRWADSRAWRVLALAACVLVGVGLAACGRAPASPEGDQPVIVASIHPLAELSSRLAFNFAQVHTLLPAGASPHGFELTPRQAALLAQADLLVIAGDGSDAWAERAAASHAGRLKILRMTDLALDDSPANSPDDAIDRLLTPTINEPLPDPATPSPAKADHHDPESGESHEGHEHHDNHADPESEPSDEHAHAGEHVPAELADNHADNGSEPGHDGRHDDHAAHDHAGGHEHDHDHDSHEHHDDHGHVGDHGHDHAHDHDHEHTGSHPWLDPLMVLHFADALHRELRVMMPEREDSLRIRHQLLQGVIMKVHRRWNYQASQMPRKELVTFHNAFDGLAERYGLSVIAHLADVQVAHDGTATPARLVEAIRVIRAHRLAVVYAEPQFPEQAVSTLQRETGVTVLRLDPIGGPDVPGYETWEQLMFSNLAVLMHGQRLKLDPERGL